MSNESTRQIRKKAETERWNWQEKQQQEEVMSKEEFIEGHGQCQTLLPPPPHFSYFQMHKSPIEENFQFYSQIFIHSSSLF